MVHLTVSEYVNVQPVLGQSTSHSEPTFQEPISIHGVHSFFLVHTQQHVSFLKSRFQGEAPLPQHPLLLLIVEIVYTAHDTIYRYGLRVDGKSVLGQGTSHPEPTLQEPSNAHRVLSILFHSCILIPRMDWPAYSITIPGQKSSSFIVAFCCCCCIFGAELLEGGILGKGK